MEETPKKQLTYATFYPRVFAGMIDLFLAIFLLYPINFISTIVIFRGVRPDNIIKSVITDVMKNSSEHSGKPPSASYLFNQILADPRTHDYFITQGGLYKAIGDQALQIGVVAVVIVLCWKYFSATPGKLFMSLRIVDSSTHAPISQKQAIIRVISYAISVLPLCLGIAWIAFDKKRQAFHDKIAGTVVIKK